jgi:Putative transposase/Transposase zinc-binding domain
MITMSDIFTTYAPEYIERYPNLPASHQKAIDALCRCRTGAYGYSLYACASCGHHHHIAHACGNRHCPQCQHQKAAQWLHNQLDKQLPGAYFLITFTVPEALRPFCRSHPRLAYQSLFSASSQALKRLAKAPRFIGTTLPGFTGILHTWGRQLQYHPHIHYIVPGGGLSQDREAWLPSRANFYVPVRALSPIYRALFKQEMRTAGQLEQIAPHVWTTPWNVHSQANPNGATSFTYLAPYVCKVAIANRRIVGLQDRIVTFTYRKPGSTRLRTTRLDVFEFMRRFLHHVLPAGFMKVRHFGFMNANCRIKTDTIRQMITSQTGAALEPPRCIATTPAQVTCPNCGAPLIVLSRVWSFHMAIFDSG